MAWTTITAAQVKSRLAPQEIELHKRILTQNGEADLLQDLVDQVVDEVRGYCAAWRNNTLGATGTIPSKLVATALAIIKFRYLQILPGITLGEERRLEYDGAVKLLERVADGKFAIEDPETASEESISRPGPSFSTPDREFDSTSQDGL